MFAPKNIPYFYNRASIQELFNLEIVFEHFGIVTQKNLVGEIILRLDHHLNAISVVRLPTDICGKILFKMYKFYFSLK